MSASITFNEDEKDANDTRSIQDRSVRVEGANSQNIQDSKSSTIFTTVKDYLLTYRTNNELRVRNRYLGYMSTAFTSLIVGYCIIYIFIVSRLHIEKQKANGSSFVWLQGKPYHDANSDTAIWELSQMLATTSKSNMIVLPTRVRITKDQKMEECPTSLIPCETDADCDTQKFPNFIIMRECQTISDNKKGCKVIQWCPAEDINNQNVTKIIDLAGVTEQEVTIKSYISFPSKPDIAFYQQNNKKMIDYPQEKANTFSVENLLTLSATNYQNIKYTGCILQVNVVWECNLDQDECGSRFEVIRIDDGVGYSQKHADYQKDGETTTRQETHYSGIKIIVNVLGVGERLSVVALFLYFFTTIALLYGVRIVTDLFLLNVAREKRHYSELKYEHVD